MTTFIIFQSRLSMYDMWMPTLDTKGAKLWPSAVQGNIIVNHMFSLSDDSRQTCLVLVNSALVMAGVSKYTRVWSAFAIWLELVRVTVSQRLVVVFVTVLVWRTTAIGILGHLSYWRSLFRHTIGSSTSFSAFYLG